MTGVQTCALPITFYSAPYTDDAGDLKGVIVANKTGLGIILADRFVDATGDGDLLRDLDCETWKPSDPQPPTPGMKIAGLKNVTEPMLIKLVGEHGREVGLNPDRGWGDQRSGSGRHALFRADACIPRGLR